MFGRKKFAIAAFDPDNEGFIVYIIFLISTNVYSSSRNQIALLIKDDAPIAVLSKYTDFAHIFSLDLAAKLPKHIRVNNHFINTVNT